MGQSVGKGGQVKDSRAEELLANYANQYFQETAPVRTEVTNQMLEALKTGGVNAQLPFVQKATETAKAATSNALRQLDESLAGSGLARSPYAARARAEALTSGELMQSQIGPAFAAELISGAPSWGSAGLSQSFGGLSSAMAGWNQRAGTQAYRDVAKADRNVEYSKMAMQGASMIAAAY